MKLKKNNISNITEFDPVCSQKILEGHYRAKKKEYMSDRQYAIRWYIISFKIIRNRFFIKMWENEKWIVATWRLYFYSFYIFSNCWLWKLEQMFVFCILQSLDIVFSISIVTICMYLRKELVNPCFKTVWISSLRNKNGIFFKSCWKLQLRNFSVSTSTFGVLAGTNCNKNRVKNTTKRICE